MIIMIMVILRRCCKVRVMSEQWYVLPKFYPQLHPNMNTRRYFRSFLPVINLRPKSVLMFTGIRTKNKQITLIVIPITSLKITVIFHLLSYPTSIIIDHLLYSKNNESYGYQKKWLTWKLREVEKILGKTSEDLLTAINCC